MKAKLIAVAAGLSAVLASGAFAQGSLVSVNVHNVANDIAKNINVDVSQVPVTVQAPIAVAAAVCGVAVTVLGSQTGANPACTATSTSGALNQIVLRQIKGGTQG